MSTPTLHNEYVAILDAGSQYGKVIDRRVRELKVETVILPLDTPTAQLRDDPKLKGIIISGGPSSVHDADAPAHNGDLFTIEKPILGICYGMQLMALLFGGSVKSEAIREDGPDEIQVDLSSPVFAGMDKKQTVLLTHGDSLTVTGDSLRIIGTSGMGIITAVQHKTLPYFGLQFHPEVELTVNGNTIFRNFLSMCKCSFNFTMKDREEVAIQYIRERTSGGQKMLCLASGGVDSTVCAVLLLKALGPERVVCVHIDHGFMRLYESQQVVEALKAAGVEVQIVNAQLRFAEATTTMAAKGGRAAYTTKRLCETIDPEEKRTIIGNTFMDVCDEVIRDLKLDTNNLLLAQGTLRPDLIESGSSYASKKADAIKTHHNDTAVVRQLREAGRIIEPLCDYHKDEVRELGTRLGIPTHLVARQPFPGPGLSIRILCSDGTPFRDSKFAETESILSNVCGGQLESVLMSADFSASVAALDLGSCVLPIRTVGVQGDGRTYAYAAALSMARTPSAEDWVTLMTLAKAIPKVAHSVNRVVFLFGDKTTASPNELTPTILQPAVVDQLRLADNIVGQSLSQHNLVRKLSQVPVVLIPVSFGGAGKRSVVIRTFVTNDFMTGTAATPGSALMPLNVLDEIVTEVQKLNFVSGTMYDLTGKPPGTTEWE